MRRFVPLSVLVIAALAVLAPVAQAKLSVTMHATTHTPKVGKKWPITISAFNGRKKVCGNVRYAFLFNGKVVGHRNAGVGSGFCGHFKDPDILWPKRAIGIPLTFRAVVDTKLGQRNLDYAVKVAR
ncbi:MAG TPA: hypothetical protein VGI54_11040 [Solirubrobacteraceae bacterium]|jgi:hypothetical protein